MPKNIEVLHHFITYCRAGAALLLGGLFYLLFRIISVCYSQTAMHSITILLQYILLVDYFSAFKNLLVFLKTNEFM